MVEMGVRVSARVGMLGYNLELGLGLRLGLGLGLEDDIRFSTKVEAGLVLRFKLDVAMVEVKVVVPVGVRFDVGSGAEVGVSFGVQIKRNIGSRKYARATAYFPISACHPAITSL